jgi:hypothetical protein
MANNPIPSSDKLPPKSLVEDTQDELTETNDDEHHQPPVNMGGSRTAGGGVTDTNPATGRADPKDRIRVLLFLNRK